MLAPLGSFLIEPMKSLLSGLTHMDAPESQIIVKLSLGSMAALQATGCCSTTDSERRQLQEHVVQVEGDPEGSFDGQILGVFDGSLDGRRLGSFDGSFDGQVPWGFLSAGGSASGGSSAGWLIVFLCDVLISSCDVLVSTILEVLDGPIGGMRL